MFELLKQVDTMTDGDFQTNLHPLSEWILGVVKSDSKNEMKKMCQILLSLSHSERYVTLIESLFTTDQMLYLKLIREGSEEIAIKRKFLAG